MESSDLEDFKMLQKAPNKNTNRFLEGSFLVSSQRDILAKSLKLSLFPWCLAIGFENLELSSSTFV